MDYLKRALEVKKNLRIQLRKFLESLIPSISGNVDVFLAGANSEICLQYAADLKVLDAYVNYCKESPPKDKEAATDHLLWSLTLNQGKMVNVSIEKLAYMLTNPDWTE